MSRSSLARILALLAVPSVASAADLIHYWDFEGATRAEVLSDKVGTSSIFGGGAAPTSAGYIGAGWRMSSNDTWTAGGSIPAVDAFTVSFWRYKDSIDDSAIVVGQAYAGVVGDGGSYPRVGLPGETSERVESTLPAGRWTMITVAVDEAGVFRYWVDDELVFEKAGADLGALRANPDTPMFFGEAIYTYRADGVCDAPDVDDADGDGVADDCDACPADTHDDSDGDGSCDGDDPCPMDAADDADDDGVPDDLDLCIDSAPGAIVSLSGCSVEQACPCDGAWKNPGAYPSCVARTTGAMVAEGSMTASQKAAVTSSAASSRCGKK